MEEIENDTTETTETVENPSPAVEEKDYFGDHTEMIDDDGNPVTDALPASSEEAALNAETPEAKAAAETAAETAKAGEGKVGDLAGPGKGDKPLEAPTEGFISRFYKEDDKGVRQFQHDAAIKMLYPEGDGGKAFAYAPVNVRLEDPAAAKAKDEEIPAWKTDLEADRKEKESTRTAYFAGLGIAREAVKQGYTAEEALNFAEQKLTAHLEDHNAERQFAAETKRAEANENRIQSETELRQIRDQATKNEMAYHEVFGGQKAFHEVFFGYTDVKGQQVQGLASDYLWQLFKMNNPEHKNGAWTAKETGEKMADWYTKTAADPDSMKFIVEIARGKLLQNPTMKRMFIDKVRSTATDQNKSNKTGNLRRGAAGAPVPRTPSAEEANTTSKELDQFLNPAEPREEEVATI